jgi:hypothetical protein
VERKKEILLVGKIAKNNVFGRKSTGKCPARNSFVVRALIFVHLFELIRTP